MTTTQTLPPLSDIARARLADDGIRMARRLADATSDVLANIDDLPLSVVAEYDAACAEVDTHRHSESVTWVAQQLVSVR